MLCGEARRGDVTVPYRAVMKPASWLVLVLVRLGVAAGAPRTADESLLEEVQRELTGMGQGDAYRLSSGHKLHRSHHSHRVRHRPRGTLAPEGKESCICFYPLSLYSQPSP